MKVSAIIPILNCQEYLRPCIDSVLAQTLSEIEVILACDGGRECFEICEEYVKKDKRVSIIKNRGSYG
ncbi:MAG: glycosyltransferase, partial [Alphaproteobacteria bacterium]|nr:glycosyltransferase [Alphaproteobacteria bacterium]